MCKNVDKNINQNEFEGDRVMYIKVAQECNRKILIIKKY